jgi:sulfatase maturation enzyme AslB (radical SAM superfamily)
LASIDQSEKNLTSNNLTVQNVELLHVEASSRCNAWCPACSRNNNGFGLVDGLVEQDLSIERFAEVLNSLPQLKIIQFCGNYGDPIIANNITELIALAKKHTKKIQIHTNGGLRSTKWWKSFAELLSDIDHDVWFGIDGIEKTHEIYRQGTSYQKVINNAQSFITHGGFATWQFIPYAHNEHETKDCVRLSQKMGFKKFKLVKIFRNKTIARHWKTGESFDLLPPVAYQPLIRMPKINSTVETKNCMHLFPMPSAYLSASGKISPCCYQSKKFTVDNMSDLFYNPVDLTDSICLSNCGS